MNSEIQNIIHDDNIQFIQQIGWFGFLVAQTFYLKFSTIGLQRVSKC